MNQMNKSNFFILSQWDPASTTGIYLLGPDNLSQEDFIKLTDVLYSEAVILLIKEETEKLLINNFYYPKIIDQNIVNSKIVELLCLYYNFSIINPKESSYYDHRFLHLHSTLSDTEYYYKSEDFNKLNEEAKIKLINYGHLYINSIKKIV